MPRTSPTRVRLLPPGNTTHRPRATLRLGLAGLALAGVFQTAGASASAQPAPATSGWRLGAEAPSPQQVLDVYRAVRGSLVSWSAPSRAVGDGRRACFVSIRLEGREIGSGAGWPAVEQDPVREAIDAALREAGDHAPIARDALREQRLRELEPLLTVSVELALPAAPIDVDAVEALDAALLPGLEGVAVERDGKVVAVSPAQMLAGGLTPAEAARGAIAKLLGSAELSLERWPALKAKFGLTLLKFRTVHAAQPAAGAEPVFLERGSRLAYLTDIDSLAEMRAWVDQLAGALLRRVDASGFRAGPYRLDRAAWEETEGVDRALLAALALGRLIDLPEGDLPAPTREAARAALGAILERARREAPSATLSAFRLLVGRGEPGEVEADAKQIRQAMAAPGAAPPAVRALWVCGLAYAPNGADDARAALTQLVGSADAGATLEMWPWLPWAALRLGQGAESVPAAGLLSESRSVLESHRLTPALATLQPDLVGGVVIGAGPPWPTWTTARLSAALPAMLADERLTPEAKRSSPVMALLNTLRFLKQLTVDASAGWMCRAPAQAAGMVRMAPWEVRSSVDAQAMTLITVCDTLTALPRLKPKPPAPAPSNPR